MPQKISIIIPNYNRVQYLKQTLDSVVAQTYHNWEALVVDDGSTDGSKSLVENYIKSDPRIKWIERQEPLKGASVCRNLGIKKALGDYVIFLDSDDMLAPQCLEQRLGIMQDYPALDFAVFKMQFFKETPGDDQRIWNRENETSPLDRFLKLDAVWQTSGPIWKREALKRIEGFNPNLKCWQDIDIHLKALFAKLTFKICYDFPVDCYYRKDATDSISQSTTNSPEKLKSKIELYGWVQKKAQENNMDASQMAVNILLSTLNGRQYQIFTFFYKKVKHVLPKKTKNILNKIMLINKFRLDRLAFVRGLVLRWKTSIISKHTIGTYHV